MANQQVSGFEKNDDHYINAINGFRIFALSIPPLCASLSSALLAFQIYYLQFVYKPKPGFYPEDAIVVLPMVVGVLFLVAAALAVDWVVDSMSPVEAHALRSRYPSGAVPDEEYAKGFYFRATLFSGAYLLFCICHALLLFLLVAAVPIFLKDDVASGAARGIILFAGAYYSMLILLKMLTTTLSRKTWLSLGLGGLLFFLGNVWSLLYLLKVF
jgi:hypothetical protein